MLYCNEDSYFLAGNCKSLTAYNFCYECGRDIISLKIWKSPHDYDCGSLKQVFFGDTLYII